LLVVVLPVFQRMASPEGIVPTGGEPQASRGVPDDGPGETRLSEAKDGEPKFRELEPAGRLAASG
jgi:hypothetical protein